MKLPIVFVLVETRSPGNIGAVCRAAGAFGLSGVRLVRPECDAVHEEARWLAHGAENMLRAVSTHDGLREALADCSRAVATTARPRHWRRPVLTPDTTTPFVAEAADERPFAVVFGPEDRGLTNEDLAECDAVLSIPLPPSADATLSLPAAATIVAWELTRGDRAGESASASTADAADPPLDAADLDDLLDDIERTLAGIGFRPRPDAARFRGSLRDFLSRARPTTGDHRLLRHVFAQIGKWQRRIRGEARRGLFS